MSKRSSSIFSPRMVMILAGLGIVAMMGMLLVSALGSDRSTKMTVGPNSYSVSVLGHRALMETIEAMDIPVMVSQYRTLERLDPINSLLLLLEPSLTNNSMDDLRELLTHNSVIYALPKRRPAMRQQSNLRWLQSDGMVSTGNVDKFLKLIDSNAQIIRPDAKPVVQKSDDESEEETVEDNEVQDEDAQEKGIVIDLSELNIGRYNRGEETEYDGTWTENIPGFTPSVKNVQLISSDIITPLIASEQGILVGSIVNEFGGTTIIVSDPDLISNMGIGEGENAQIIFYLIELFSNDFATIFVDETIHGFERNPELMRSAFEHPFIYFTFQVLIFVVLLVWATLQRFGSPPKMMPQFRTGKAVLIESAVNLLNHGNHKPEILARYVELTQNAMAKKLKAPKNLSDDEIVEWLDDYGARRGVELSLKTIKHRAMMSRSGSGRQTNTYMDHVHEKPLIQIAKFLQQWKQEMLDGSGTDKIN